MMLVLTLCIMSRIQIGLKFSTSLLKFRVYFEHPTRSIQIILALTNPNRPS
jgi:hypothetical protein